MKKLILFFLICHSSSVLMAQKCDEFAQLYGTVIKEFPGVSYDNPTKDRKLFDRISYNLISDKHFFGIRKKSFSDLSEKDVEKLKKKLFKCSNVNGCWQLRDYLYRVLLSSNLTEAKNNVRRIRSQRDQYEQSKINLKKDLNFDELLKQEKSINSHFSLLTIVETNELSGLIKSKKQTAADKDLLLRRAYINSLPDHLKSVLELDAFKGKNSLLYEYASSSVKAALRTLIETRKQEILKNLAVLEKENLDQVSFAVSDIQQINSLFEELVEKYTKYRDYSSVKSIYEHYKKKKTIFVSTNAYEIAQKAKGFYRVKELEHLQQEYLSNTHLSPNIKKLNEYFNGRKETIEKYLREREERLKREELERKNLVKEKKALIAQKRRELEIKYESKLPTIEDIFDIMRLGAQIKDRFYTSDGKKFIRRAENLGYMQVSDDLYSDINTFRNSKGWELFTVRLDDEQNKQIGVTGNFKVENVPQEIVELYVIELTTEYRKNDSPYVEPWDGGEIKAVSGNYIKSGTTFYSYDLKDGNLQITALDNLDAKGLVVAEKIAHNRVKITPWTNYTNIRLKKGDQLMLRANGSITLGTFSVACYPKGISGFRTHNVDRRFNHGCLIGKIGDGDWFYVGAQKTITADQDGLLQLRINDNKESDNDGHFEVTYSFN